MVPTYTPAQGAAVHRVCRQKDEKDGRPYAEDHSRTSPYTNINSDDADKDDCETVVEGAP